VTALILLDVDGVLNPRLAAGRLQVPAERAALVRELAALGRLVWATTYPAVLVHQMAEGIGLDEQAEAIAFPADLDADPRHPAPTPKLHWVQRWLSRQQFSAVAWVDDRLGADAAEWARTASVLLVSPDPRDGLRAEHVDAVRGFVGAG
jgi:hypothetical protein